MKNIVFCSILYIIIYCFCSCDNDNRPVVKNLPIETELPVYINKNNKPGLINDNEIKRQVLVLNSEEEVKANLTNVFLNEYTDYLDIDFTKYSLLIKTSIIDYKILRRKINYYYTSENNRDYYNLQIDYYVGDQFSEKEFLIERVGIVVDKIKNNSTIEFKTSYSKK